MRQQGDAGESASSRGEKRIGMVVLSRDRSGGFSQELPVRWGFTWPPALGARWGVSTEIFLSSSQIYARS